MMQDEKIQIIIKYGCNSPEWWQENETNKFIHENSTPLEIFPLFLYDLRLGKLFITRFQITRAPPRNGVHTRESLTV